MCQSSPGPRCSRHAQQQLERSHRRLSNLRQDHAKTTADIDDAVNHLSYLSDEELDTLRSKQQDIQEQIEDQVDRVSADRDAYWTTPKGRENLKEQIAKYQAVNNLRAVHTLTARLERAEQEYEHRVLAGKVARQERERLESSNTSEEYNKYVSSTTNQRKILRRDEVQAIGEVEHWRQKLTVTSGNAQEIQHARQQAHAAAVRAKKAQTLRRSLEETDYAKRAGIPGFIKVTDMNDVNSLNDGNHYLRLKSADFGAAREHFPTGALVKITASHKDDVGNTVLELETGDKRLVYSDAVVVKALVP